MISAAHPSPRRKLPEGILLGWKTASKAPPGFATYKPTAGKRYEPIVYRGDGHLLTIAPTGAGKAINVAIPALLTYEGPIIALDIKPELAAVAARRRREMGHRVITLAPLDANSDGLNPMDLFAEPGAMVDVLSETMASALSVGHRFATDPYWTDTANGLVAGLIAHVATSAPPEKRNLNEVRRWMMADDLDYDIAVALDNKSVVNRMAREKFVAYLTAPTDKTRPCIRSTAMSHLDTLGSDSVAAMLDHSTFNLQDLREGRDVDVFMVMPADRLESHASVLRLCLSTLLTAIIRRTEIPRARTLLLIDEAGQLGGLDALRQAVTLFRGAGLTCWLFFQDVSQIRRNFDRDWETIVNNCGVLTAFSVQTRLMAEMISHLIDLPPHELLNMPADQQALFIQREGAQFARRLHYMRDPIFKGLYDPNPRYAKVGDRFLR